jgi:hypothetical protein
MDNFKEASRLKLRFSTERGLLSAEQLWDLPVTELDAVALNYEEQFRVSGKKSFLVKKSVKDKTIKLQFDIVLDVLTTKVEEMEAARDAKGIKEHNDKILNIIAEKQDEGLKNMSIKDLEKQLK